MLTTAIIMLNRIIHPVSTPDPNINGKGPMKITALALVEASPKKIVATKTIITPMKTSANPRLRSKRNFPDKAFSF